MWGYHQVEMWGVTMLECEGGGGGGSPGCNFQDQCIIALGS